jgi:hypothetical protein
MNVDTLERLDGRRVAILLAAKTAEGEDDWAVFQTIASWDGITLRFRYPAADGDAARPLAIQWTAPDLPDIQIAKAEVKEIIGAELFVLFTVETLPSGEEMETMTSVGLQWPTKPGG